MKNRQKYEQEIGFWALEIEDYAAWCRGDIPELYGIPSPNRPDAAASLALATIAWTWADRHRYLKHLRLPADHFTGKQIADIGAGPLALGRFFHTAKGVLGIDPLADVYARLGYPLKYVAIDGSQAEANCIRSFAEQMAGACRPDAVISVNALDHVDDFEKAINQIKAMVQPGGIIRVELHYHKATVTEPLELTDDRVARAFAGTQVHKLSELSFGHFYPGYDRDDEMLVLWSNDDTIYDGPWE